MVSIEKGATVYLDTDALICMTEGSGAFKAKMESLVQSALAAQARFVTSEPAITEVLVAPIREQNQGLLNAYDELFESFVQALPVSRAILVRVARLRAGSLRLRTPDAIHLASAEQSKASIFVTGDAAIPVSDPMTRHLLSG